MKKIICIILALIMLFSLAACKGGKDVTPPQEDNTEQDIPDDDENQPAGIKSAFILPYNEADPLNPYKAETQVNRVLTTLLYDSLYTLDEGYSPIPLIADSAEVESAYVTVKIKNGIAFGDSSQLNASDVVYSFYRAKESERYSELLKGISGAVALELHSVKFNLSQPDAYVLNLLTFPIIKYGTAEDKVPYGSGRYALSAKKLSYNREHISGVKPRIKNIGLYPLKDNVNFVDALQIGNISFIFKDLSDCDIQRAVARSVPVTLNNLVYIGINGKHGILKNKTVRQAINLAIDKENIVSHDFQGYAVRAESPFNPKWNAVKEKNSVFDQSEAVRLLEEGGCKYISETDKYRKDKNGNSLIFKILVCEENEFRLDAAESIAKNLAQVGIGAEITAMKFKKYKEAVKSGSFDLYIGEVRLCENMSLSPFFTKSGKTRYGIDQKSKIIDAYEAFESGEKTVAAFENEFSDSLPFIPLCYRQGMVMTANTLSDNVKSVSTDMFANIDEWKMN